MRNIISEVLFNAEYESGLRVLLSGLVKKIVAITIGNKNCLTIFFKGGKCFSALTASHVIAVLTQFVNIVLI